MTASNWLLPASNFSQTGAVRTDFYHDSDLVLGAEINVWGRKMVICDCDDFTKEFYQHKYGIGMPSGSIFILLLYQTSHFVTVS